MIYLFVEGHGEIEAARKLVYKIRDHYALGDIHFSNGYRWKNLHQEQGIAKAIDYARTLNNVDGVLLLRDDEDNCPKDLAPARADFIRSLNPPFPVSYSILYREFETLFLSVIESFSGRVIDHDITGKLSFIQGIESIENPELNRNAKGKVSDYLSGGRVYKPTTDQLVITKYLDVAELDRKALPCFHTLVRCITHLVSNVGNGAVYPQNNAE